MKNRKVLAVIMALVMVLGSFSVAFAAAEDAAFADMPDNWSTAALQAAVDNGLLKGYSVNGETLIQPDKSLTRAEMATVVNRAFGATATASISSVSDVSSSDWFASEMAKAVQMETFALADKMRPNDKITRQEAFAVLSRAFGTASEDTSYKALNAYTDKGSISSWAKADVAGLIEAGYVEGSSGKLNPLANITRAEFATVMSKLVKQYVDDAGTLTAVSDGNVLIRVAGVTLKDLTVKGDLIIGDGVGTGDVTLDSVTVNGTMVVRGGGENSIKILAGSKITGKIYIKTVNNEVRIYNEEGAVISEAVIDGSQDVILEGDFGDVVIESDDVVVRATSATINSAAITGESSKLIVESGSTITSGTISGKSSGIEVSTGGTVTSVTVSGTNATVSGTGTVSTVTVTATASNVAVDTPKTVTTVATGATGVTAGGTDVPAGSTATNNASGTGATVTTTTSGGGGGGGGGSNDDLYVTVGSSEYAFPTLEGLYLNDANLETVVHDVLDTLVDSYGLTDVAVSGSGIGIYEPIGTASDDDITVMFTSCASITVDTITDRATRISNTTESAVGITGFAYRKDGTSFIVSKVEIYGGPLIATSVDPYVLWTSATADPTRGGMDLDSFDEIYDAVYGDSVISLAGLTIVITTNEGARTVVLHYE